ncbi:hypothetical protein CG471_14920, partial [Sphingobium sp. IP1]
MGRGSTASSGLSFRLPILERMRIMATALRHSIDRFADLPTLYAQMVATPEYQAAFGDPMPLTIAEPGDAPAEHEMPEP